jgi:YD repeat-containing protein
LNLQNNYEDSTVVYYNKNGLIEYSEMWQPIGKKNQQKTKLTCRRYEYDDQNRVTRYVVNYPTPRTAEYTYTYDSLGNATIHYNPKNRDLWD